MPAIGRNVRSPESLLTALRELIDVLIARPALEKEHQDDLVLMSQAIRDVSDIDDPAVVDESLAAIAALLPEAVKPGSFLAPFSGVTSFKGTMAIVFADATSRNKALTKSLVFSTTRKHLVKVSVGSDICEVSAFYNLVLRSTAYVNEVVAKKSTTAEKEKEISIYNQLVGDLLEKVASLIQQCDMMIGDAISDRKPETLDSLKNLLKSLRLLTNALPFKEADFFSTDGDSKFFKTWQDQAGSIPARITLVAALSALWATPEEDTESVLAAVVDVQSKYRSLKVPLVETCDKQLCAMVTGFNLENKASAEFKTRFKDFIDNAFGYEFPNIPSEDTVNDMLRWTQYSMTPARDKALVEATPRFAVLISAQMDIDAAIDELNKRKSSDKVVFCDIIREAVAEFDHVMPLNDPESTVQRMEILGISDKFNGLSKLAKKLRVAVGSLTGAAVNALSQALHQLQQDWAAVACSLQHGFDQRSSGS